MSYSSHKYEDDCDVWDSDEFLFDERKQLPREKYRRSSDYEERSTDPHRTIGFFPDDPRRVPGRSKPRIPRDERIDPRNRFPERISKSSRLPRDEFRKVHMEDPEIRENLERKGRRSWYGERKRDPRAKYDAEWKLSRGPSRKNCRCKKCRKKEAQYLNEMRHLRDSEVDRIHADEVLEDPGGRKEGLDPRRRGRPRTNAVLDRRSEWKSEIDEEQSEDSTGSGRNDSKFKSVRIISADELHVGEVYVGKNKIPLDSPPSPDSPRSTQDPLNGSPENLTVQLCVNMDSLSCSTQPDYGSHFVIKGTLFPEDTIKADCRDVFDEDGNVTAQHSKKVLGTWISWGSFISSTSTADIQIFDFKIPGLPEKIVTTGMSPLLDPKDHVRTISGGSKMFEGGSVSHCCSNSPVNNAKIMNHVVTFLA